MSVHNINVLSGPDCQMLIDRIRRTLVAVKPSVLSNINAYPKPFPANDQVIFEYLVLAVFSNQTKWKFLKPHLPEIKNALFNYNINLIAALSDIAVHQIYMQKIYRLKIPSGIKIEKKLLWIRNNASTFLKIQKQFGSVLNFMQTELAGSPFDDIHNCYIHPNDKQLLKHFSKGMFKLGGVGDAICCEFFNGIGIDEFKPDVHTCRFIKRIGIVPSGNKDKVREAGITIARTLGQPRKYVDSHLWIFCADGEGEICTEKTPQCHVCQLKNIQPQLCAWC